MTQELPSNIRYDDNTKTYYFASEDTPGQYNLPEAFKDKEYEAVVEETAGNKIDVTKIDTSKFRKPNGDP
jgi:YHS domain-containing protein